MNGSKGTLRGAVVTVDSTNHQSGESGATESTTAAKLREEPTVAETEEPLFTFSDDTEFHASDWPDGGWISADEIVRELRGFRRFGSQRVLLLVLRLLNELGGEKPTEFQFMSWKQAFKVGKKMIEKNQQKQRTNALGGASPGRAGGAVSTAPRSHSPGNN